MSDVAYANTEGIYRSLYMNHNENKKPIRISAYFVTSPGVKPPSPGGNTKWYNSLVQEMPMDSRTSRSCPQLKRCLPEEAVTAPTMVHPQPKRRRNVKVRVNSPTEDAAFAAPAQVGTPPANPIPPPVNVTPPPAIIHQSYFESPEAIRLFCTRQEIEDELVEDARDSILSRIEKMTVMTNAMQWRSTVEDFDQNNLCTAHEIFSNQMRCLYISNALKHALNNMPGDTWFQCCSHSIDSLKAVGITAITNPRTVMDWHARFRKHNDCFPNPAAQRKKKGSVPPPLRCTP